LRKLPIISALRLVDRCGGSSRALVLRGLLEPDAGGLGLLKGCVLLDFIFSKVPNAREVAPVDPPSSCSSTANALPSFSRTVRAAATVVPAASTVLPDLSAALVAALAVVVATLAAVVAPIALRGFEAVRMGASSSVCRRTCGKICR
jgi:hypothetical protein